MSNPFQSWSLLPPRRASLRGDSRPHRRPLHRHLAIESLEDRKLLAVVAVDLLPVQDNTLYESTSGAVSNGAGSHLFSGTTALGSARRGVLAFDVAGVVPSGATITDVGLQLHMSRTTSGPQTVELHRLTSDWGEGTSDAPGNEGGGAASTAGDATWVHTFFPDATWTTPGGDYLAAASASTSVAGVGDYTWSSAEMVTDVQDWLDMPTDNQGWILIGNEGAAATAKRFDSRENSVADNRPVLSITYDDGNFFPTADIVGRHVFYNDSSFDGNDPGPGAGDDDAIAPDKEALRPGQTATFANYTSYSRGINGIMIDVDGLSDAANLSAADFELRVGNDNDPATWSVAPPPQSVTVRPGDGLAGSDRVTLIWGDNAIEKQWLQVTALATENTGLAVDDVSYFGNAIAESGNSTDEALVSSIDEIGARSNPQVFVPAALENVFDYNRDMLVSSIDQILARRNLAVFNALRLIAAPALSELVVLASAGTLPESSVPGPMGVEAVATQAATPAAQDSALVDLVGQESEVGGSVWSLVNWLDGLDQVMTSGSRPAEHDPAADTVDRLLATYWI